MLHADSLVLLVYGSGVAMGLALGWFIGAVRAQGRRRRRTAARAVRP